MFFPEIFCLILTLSFHQRSVLNHSTVVDCGSLGSSGGNASSCGLDGPGPIPSRSNRFFLLRNVQKDCEPNQAATQWIPGSFPGVKMPGPEPDHSPSSSGELKNEWSDTSTPCIRLHDVDKKPFSPTLCNIGKRERH